MKKTIYIKPSAEIVRLHLKNCVNDYEGGIDEGEFGNASDDFDSGDIGGKENDWDDDENMNQWIDMQSIVIRRVWD